MHSIVLAPSPRRRLALATALAMLVAVPFASAAEAGITTSFKPDSTVQLAPGVTYKVGKMRTTGGLPQSVRVATVDPTHPGVQLKALLSNNKVVQREVVTKIALSRSRPGFRPMVATNGDMSVRNRVDAYAAPLSMAVSGGELMVAQACVRPTLGVDADGDARIGNVRADLSVVPPGKKYTVRIHRVNTHRDDGLVVLFTKRFAYEFQRSDRYRSPLTCVMIDIDHFKQVNDNWGHAAGDAVLRELAQRVESQVRASDVAARYGGEEFVILLPNTDVEAAASLAERVRQAIAASPIALPNGESVTVTASIGIAEAAPGPDEKDLKTLGDSLIARADVALYAAKSAGRDRVIVEAA